MKIINNSSDNENLSRIKILEDIGELLNLKIVEKTEDKFITNNFYTITENKIETLNINIKNKQYLPDIIFRLDHLLNLKTGRTDLSNIPNTSQIFKTLKSFNSVLFCSKNIQNLIPKFSNLRKLQINISNFDSNFYNNICKSTKLEHIYITSDKKSNNEIFRLEYLPKCMINLKNLEYLSFHEQNLMDISDINLEVKTLKEFHVINNNKPIIIPNTIKFLSNLETLILRHNNIEILPNEIQHLSKLKKLDLSENNLKKIPDEVLPLKNLNKLYLDRNKIESIPKNINYLDNLENLHLHGNILKKLPITIGNLKKLKYLNLSLNKITSLPDEIGDLSNLEYLDLNYNNLRILPKSISKLKKLKILRLNRNNWEKFDYKFDRNTFPNLEYIDLPLKKFSLFTKDSKLRKKLVDTIETALKL